MKRIAMAVGLVVVVIAGCGGDGEGEPDAAAVIMDYESAYNTGEIDAVMALFTEDSTISDHPAFPSGTAAGLDAIRQLHIGAFTLAALPDAYEFSNIDASGDTVTWDHTFAHKEDGEFCGTGNTAVISGGTIQSWAFAPDWGPCEVTGNAG